MRVHSAKVSSCRPATWPPGLASAITLRHRKARHFSVPTTCGWGETLILRSVSGLLRAHAALERAKRLQRSQ